MKKVCYLILAHNNISQIQRVIKHLDSGQASFCIHIDTKCPEDYSTLTLNPNVSVFSRYDIRWGETSMIDAERALCEHAVSHIPARHYILLSGADYPVKRAFDIESFLEKNSEVSFIQGERLPTHSLPWLEGGGRRLHAYAVPLGNRRIASIEPRRLNTGNLRQIVKTMLFAPQCLPHALKILLFNKRRIPPTDIYGGEFWWILTHKLLVRMLEFDKANPRIYDFIKESCNPDEIYFNTLAYTVGDAKIEKRGMRHVSWSAKGNSPRWLTIRDRDEIAKAVNDPDNLFIRKTSQPDVCDLIDNLLGLEI